MSKMKLAKPENTLSESLPGERDFSSANASLLEHVHLVPLDQIDTQDRLRGVDESWARIVADSFTEVDQLQPIDLMKRPDGQLVLVDGNHRFAAAALLGWEHIRAHIRDLDESNVRLRQIDANLIRRELNPLDRAAFLAARKDHYEAIYPETKVGAQGGRGGKKEKIVKFTFSKDAAEKTGLSRSTIEKAVWLDEHLLPAVKILISGTEFAEKQSSLMALARLDPDTQEKVAGLLTRKDKPARTVKEAHDMVLGVRKGRSQREINCDRLIALYNKCDAKTRSDFLYHVRGSRLPKGWSVDYASS